MSVSPTDILWDLPITLILFGIIMFTVFLTKRLRNVWVNRKFIHLSSAPAVLAYMYVLKEPYIFFSFAVFFTLLLLVPHLKSKELNWFQVEHNFGEVFYCISFGALSIAFWNLDKVLAGVVMLFMAVGDSVTGMIRSRFVNERKKHWTGTLGMFLTCSAIGFSTFGIRGIMYALVATVSEHQPWVDDNLSVHLITALASFIMPAL